MQNKSSLPSHVLTGDRFRLLDKHRRKYHEAMIVAGWRDDTARLDYEYEAIGMDDYGHGSRCRIRTSQPPYYFYQNECTPVYRSEQERLTRLTNAGWQQLASGNWKRKSD
jgi:hypothetical protein